MLYLGPKSATTNRVATYDELTGGVGITWNEITTTSTTLAVNNGYVLNNASLVTVTLPASFSVGDKIYIVGKGAGGWKIAQNASQLIHFGSKVTITGITGYVSSNNQFDCIELTGTVANTELTVNDSSGNITMNV